MLAHVLAVLGLALYAHEVYRTIRNFALARRGMIGKVVGLPAAHLAMAVLFGGLLWTFARRPSVPTYVIPVGLAISGAYAVAALWALRPRTKAA